VQDGIRERDVELPLEVRATGQKAGAALTAEGKTNAASHQ